MTTLRQQSNRTDTQCHRCGNPERVLGMRVIGTGREPPADAWRLQLPVTCGSGHFLRFAPQNERIIAEINRQLAGIQFARRTNAA